VNASWAFLSRIVGPARSAEVPLVEPEVTRSVGARRSGDRRPLGRAARALDSPSGSSRTVLLSATITGSVLREVDSGWSPSDGHNEARMQLSQQRLCAGRV
jgi:hypothetical protein